MIKNSVKPKKPSTRQVVEQAIKASKDGAVEKAIRASKDGGRKPWPN